MAINRIRRLAGNVSSLLTSEVVNRATTFVLYALISRFLGAYEFGQLSLAITFITIAQVLAGIGLKTLITREVAKDPDLTSQYFINGSVVVVVSTLFSVCLLAAIVGLMNYTAETTSVILLLSIGVLPFSLSVISKSIFRAWERMHYIVWANVPVNVAKLGVAFFLLLKGYGIIELVWLLLASYTVILVIEWYLLLRYIVQPKLRVERSFCLGMIRSTGPFLGITIIVAINVNIDVILLSRFTNEVQVGLYGAAAQLITPLIVIYETVMLSVFPEMVRNFTVSMKSLCRFSSQVLELLMSIAFPAVVGLSLLSDQAFLLLYGNQDFVQASPVLRILAWTLILWASTHVLGRILVASLREKVTLRIVMFSTLLKFTLGLILISKFGLIGAAVSAMLTGIVDFLLHYVSVSKLLFRVSLVRFAWKPFVASMCMAVYLVMVRGQGLLLVIFFASILYAAILLILLVWTNGGPRQLKAKYQYLLSKQQP